MKNTDKILSYLEDEQSKFIYQKRVEYNETGNFDAIKAIVARYLPEFRNKPYYPGMEAELPKRLEDKRNIVIFGSGMNGKGIARSLKTRGIMPVCYADNARDKWGTWVEGLEVRNPLEIDFKEVDAVVVTPFKNEIVEAMHKQLLELGVKEEILLNYKDFSAAVLEHKLYFELDLMQFCENEVFVDAGALNLETSLRFMEECKKSHVQHYQIHAFEPDCISYDKCKNMLTNMTNVDIQLYNAGLWSEDTTLYFAETGNAASRISTEQTGTSIKAVALDNCISDLVTFIKMDIEGAELEALKGSKEILKSYRPKLAISLYHKKEDLVELPAYIKELVPEYKLYVRHYSNASIETVLYAV
ncbi:FkbM family methyltransferase [Lachnospiraceae bacterium MD335]|nr:FkbM family methyltransferase [Lachnospiraceae bacterium MD335]